MTTSSSRRICSRTSCRPSTWTAPRSWCPMRSAKSGSSARGRPATSGSNAVAGRLPEEYGLEPTTFDEIRIGCFDVDERVKDMNANGVLGLVELPVHGPLLRAVLRLPRPAGPRPRPGGPAGLQRLAHRALVRRLPGAVHPLHHPADLGSGADGGRDPPDRGQGIALRQLLDEPARPRASLAAQRPLGSVLGRVRRDRHGRDPAHRIGRRWR